MAARFVNTAAMSDPYRAPRAELSNSDTALNYPTLRWKVLWLLLVPLEVWGQYDVLLYNDYGDSLTWRLFSLLVYGLYFVGLFGLAFAKPIFSRIFWLRFLPFLIVVDLIEIYDVAISEEEFYLFATALISPLIVLLWYSVYKYAKVLPYLKAEDVSNGSVS